MNLEVNSFDFSRNQASQSLRIYSRMEHLSKTGKNLVHYYKSLAPASEKKSMNVFVRGKCAKLDTF